MDFWQKARSFAEEAAKLSQEITKEAAMRSQEFTKETAKRSQDLTIGSSKFSDIISETTKRSKELVLEASNRAEQIRVEAAKRADQIKHLIEGIPPSSALVLSETVLGTTEEYLERYGITEELRDFIKGITMSTFKDFPMEDDSQVSDIPTVSNVRQDLTEWQAKHANLVISTVKDISKLRYELCPRVMKERKFWRIYFILMNRHVAPYEKQYMEKVKLESTKQTEDDRRREPSKSEVESTPVVKGKIATSSSTDQDLDIFLLGDPRESDEGPDDGDEVFDDDFDKMVDSSDDDDKEKL